MNDDHRYDRWLQGRSPKQQAANQRAMEIIVEAGVILIGLMAIAYLLGLVFGWWTE
jgi:hypothetical protein